MVKKKTEEPATEMQEEKKTAKRTSKKEKQPLSPEHGVIILACKNESFLEKLNKLAEKEGVTIVLTNEKVIDDYLAQKAGEIDETARMTAFLKDERNRAVAFEHAKEIYRILTHGKGKLECANDIPFSKSEVVHLTTLSWKKAEEMLNTLHAFGYIHREDKDMFTFQFEIKSICEKIEKDVAFSVESLNLEIQRYKGVVEKSDLENKEQMIDEFTKKVQKNIVY